MRITECSILDMFNGGLRKQVDAALAKTIDNITDPFTDESARRSIIIQFDFSPYGGRSQMTTTATVKTKLAARDSVRTTLAITADDNGELKAVEWDGQMEGQQSL